MSIVWKNEAQDDLLLDGFLTLHIEFKVNKQPRRDLQT